MALRSDPIPQHAVGYDPDLKPYAFDPEKAKQLLAEAGPKLAQQVVAKCRRLAAARPSSEDAPKLSLNSAR